MINRACLLAAAALVHATAAPRPFASLVRELPAPRLDFVNALSAWDSLLFMPAQGVLYRSADGGVSWEPCRVDRPSQIPFRDPSLTGANGHLWMAGEEDKQALRSDDAGRSWRALGNPQDTGHLGLIVRGDTVYSLGYRETLRYLPPGGRWQRPADTSQTQSLVPLGRWLYAFRSTLIGGYEGIYRTLGPGRPWERAEAGLPKQPFGVSHMTLFGRPGSAFVATDSGLYRRGPADTLWRKDTAIFGTWLQGKDYLAILQPGKVWLRSDATGAWTSRPGAQDVAWNPMAAGSRWFTCSGSSASVSDDSGSTWRPFPQGTLPFRNGSDPIRQAVRWRDRTFLFYQGMRTYSLYWTKPGGREAESHEWGLSPALNSLDWLVPTTGTLESIDFWGQGPVRSFNTLTDAWREDPTGGRYPHPIGHWGAGADEERRIRLGFSGTLQIGDAEEAVMRDLPSDPRIPHEYSMRIYLSGNAILMVPFRHSYPTAWGTFDLGGHWDPYPAAAPMLLAGGCIHWAEAERLRSRCPDAADTLVRPAPKGIARLWDAGDGGIYVWGDSVLYFTRPRDPAARWDTIATRAMLSGWSFDGDRETLSRHVDGKVQWFDPDPGATVSLAAPGLRDKMPLRRAAAWINAGRRPDGRALPAGRIHAQ